MHTLIMHIINQVGREFATFVSGGYALDHNILPVIVVDSFFFRAALIDRKTEANRD